MNYFFFLKDINKNFESSIDIFNLPPMKSFYKSKITKRQVVTFFLDKSKWRVFHLDDILPQEIKTYHQKDLIKKFGQQSFFLGLFEEGQTIFQNDDYMNSDPAWRSNICIKSIFSKASYQGEFPNSLSKKKISLVSCNPMSQNSNNVKSYFYLVNLFHEPIREKFKVEVLNSNKKVIDELYCYTNTINYFEITNSFKKNDILIFKSINHGGIPIYFNFTKNYKHLSMEHTHPPVEYVYGGNRLEIQKEKKSFWFGK